MRQNNPVQNNYKKVVNFIKPYFTGVTDIAWAVGTSALILLYPLAISILDDRFLKKKAKQNE